ncbi:MAG: LLM class flavin-dependent oxidoreductase, partial [Rhodospirillales bacterium]
VAQRHGAIRGTVYPRLQAAEQARFQRNGFPGQTIRDTVELAVLAEELGYHRFWVSEHHNNPTIIGSAPEIMMAAISQRTSTIRLGSAGVMLPHYSPLKVAEQFRVLESLAPGRIDLGLGRAPGGDASTGYALNPNAPEDANNFPANVRDLLAWVSGSPLLEGHPFGNVYAFPNVETSPEPWLLGTSDYGATIAAHLGVPYCFAHFITDGKGVAPALKVYRENYRPSARFPKPMAALCVWALAADTAEEASYLFQPRAYAKVRRLVGDYEPLLTTEAIDWDALTEAELQQREALLRDSIYGDADHVHGRLVEISEQFDVDEIVVLTWTHDQQARRRSFELLAKAAGMA